MSISILFEQDASLVNELFFLLSREQVSLINMDIDSIEAMLDEKDALLKKINASVQIRYKALAKAGFEPSEDGMNAWVEKNAQMKQLQAWQDFQKALEQAKELNRLNGQLINKHFNRNQQLLHHLQGTPSMGVYGANGQTTSQNYSRKTLAV